VVKVPAFAPIATGGRGTLGRMPKWRLVVPALAALMPLGFLALVLGPGGAPSSVGDRVGAHVADVLDDDGEVIRVRLDPADVPAPASADEGGAGDEPGCPLAPSGAHQL